MTSPLSAAARAFAGTARVWLRGVGPTTLGSPAATSAITRAQLLYVGETHEQPHVLRLQMALLDAVIAARPGAVHLVLEHFTCPQQAALDALLTPGVAIPAGAGADAPRTAEGFTGVLTVLAFAKAVAGASGVPLRAYAAFPPREVARRFAAPRDGGASSSSGSGGGGGGAPDGSAAAWADMAARGWLGGGDDAALADARRDALLAGSEAHWAFFNALIQGQGEEDGAVWDGGGAGGGGGFRRIFPAQVVKDAVAALTVERAWRDLPLRHRPQQAAGAAAGAPGDTDDDGGRDGVVVVLAGTGHVDYGFGIPERVAALLRLPPHVPTPAAPTAAAAPPTDDGTAPAQLIVTVRPLPDEGGGAAGGADASGDAAGSDVQPPARIAFPDGTTRQAGDLLYLFHFMDEESEESGQGTT